MSEHDENEEFSPEDPLPALRAGLDQVIAMAPELARTAHGLFKAFVEQGFSKGQALYLVAVQLTDDPGTPPS